MATRDAALTVGRGGGLSFFVLGRFLAIAPAASQTMRLDELAILVVPRLARDGVHEILHGRVGAPPSAARATPGLSDNFTGIRILLHMQFAALHSKT